MCATRLTFSASFAKKISLFGFSMCTMFFPSIPNEKSMEKKEGNAEGKRLYGGVGRRSFLWFDAQKKKRPWDGGKAKRVSIWGEFSQKTVNFKDEKK